MEFSRAQPKEHMHVARLFGGLALELNDVANILELCLSDAAFFATEAPQDESSLFFPANLDQPTWRFRHEPDDDEEENQGNNLESDGESPYERRSTVTVE